MTEPKMVHMFTSGEKKNVSAVTYDKSGANLPTDRKWEYWKSFDENISVVRIGFDDEVRAGLKGRGFWAPPKK
jgi:hypothetical protein